MSTAISEDFEFMDLIQDEKESKIIKNPLTNRMIKLSSTTAKALIRDGIIDSNGNPIVDRHELDVKKHVNNTIKILKKGQGPNVKDAILELLNILDDADKPEVIQAINKSIDF